MTFIDTQMLERIHDLENQLGQQEVRMNAFITSIDRVNRTVEALEETVKGIEKKLFMATGAILAVEIILKLWR